MRLGSNVATRPLHIARAAGAESVTPEQMAMLIRECSGIVCLCLTDETIRRLRLPMMVSDNTAATDQRGYVAAQPCQRGSVNPPKQGCCDHLSCPVGGPFLPYQLRMNILLTNETSDSPLCTLTPAYDICPQNRTGREASQAMRLHGENGLSQIANCLKAAPAFQLSRNAATERIARLVETIEGNWDEVCEDAALGQGEKQFFRGRQILNDFAFDGLDDNTARRLRNRAAR